MPTYDILTHRAETRNFQSRLDWNDDYADPETYRVEAKNPSEAIRKVESALEGKRRIVLVEEKVPNPDFTYSQISQALFKSKIFGDEKGYEDYRNIDFSKIYSSLEHSKDAADLLQLLSEALSQTLTPDINISVHFSGEHKYFIVRKKRDGTSLETASKINLDYLAESGRTGWDAIVYAARLILSAYYEQWEDEYHTFIKDDMTV